MDPRPMPRRRNWRELGIPQCEAISGTGTRRCLSGGYQTRDGHRCCGTHASEFNATRWWTQLSLALRLGGGDDPTDGEDTRL